MDDRAMMALLLSTAAGMATMVGAGAAVLFRRPPAWMMALSLGLAAGVMTGVSLSELLPEGISVLLIAMPGAAGIFAAGAVAAAGLQPAGVSSGGSGKGEVLLRLSDASGVTCALIMPHSTTFPRGLSQSSQLRASSSQTSIRRIVVPPMPAAVRALTVAVRARRWNGFVFV